MSPQWDRRVYPVKYTVSNAIGYRLRAMDQQLYTMLGEMCALRSIRIRRKGSGNYPGKGTDHVNGNAIHSPTPCESKREDVRDRLFPMDVDICGMTVWPSCLRRWSTTSSQYCTNMFTTMFNISMIMFMITITMLILIIIIIIINII